MAELQPNLDDMPPKFVAAITSMLPDDLDITIETLRLIAKDMTIFRSRPFKALREAIPHGFA